jgi:hypothetical protein
VCFIVQIQRIRFFLSTISASQGCKSGIRPLVRSPRTTPCYIPLRGYWILRRKVWELDTSRLTLETPSDISNLRQEGETLRKKIDEAKTALQPFVSEDLVIQNSTQFTISRTSTSTEPPQLQSVKVRQKMPWWKQIHAT